MTGKASISRAPAQKILFAGLSSLNPRRKCRRGVAHRQIRVASVYISGSIEAESPGNFAGPECGTALQRAVVAANNVVGVSIPRPPANHTRGRRSACLDLSLVRT